MLRLTWVHHCQWILPTFAFMVFFRGDAVAADIDLRDAVVLTGKGMSKREAKAVALLVDEVRKRTLIHWQVVSERPDRKVPVIALGSISTTLLPFADNLPPPSNLPAEGFRVRVGLTPGAAPTLSVQGNDSRGLLFGVGRLLRELRMERYRVSIPDNLSVVSAPKYPLRGHQLGYRPKTNSYDGWDLPQWEQYIRDLAVFGTNAVELIPPRSDDAADSPLFPRHPMEMMAGMSKILDDYGLDVWIWYPAMDADYSKPETVEFALREWAEVFQRLPRIDAVFVPGGDPGHTRPRYLLDLLEKQTHNLHRFHPQAQMWVSPQSFKRDWYEEFLSILTKEQPKWLSGVVYGPQVPASLPEMRQAIPERYAIRRYPDITHSLRCQYPVPDWDVAYALTEARECINPRPIDEAAIFRAYQIGRGFISYSEGCNDDVNKIIWSSLGWDPKADVTEILRQYSRYFIGEKYRADFADGLLALERNWRGPSATNKTVQTTLRHFQNLEAAASPRDRLNWRFQQALFRAYFDAYEQLRSIYETELEGKALAKLSAAGTNRSLASLDDAEKILASVDSAKIAPDLRARIFELAEALFQSIRMQLSVKRYGAIAIGRGTMLDTLDIPLNNRSWLKRRFQELRSLDETGRQKGIDEILHWTQPGPGGFYDDLGDPLRQPHLVKGPDYSSDPAFLKGPRVGFDYNPGWRLSWCQYAETLFDTPLRMQYPHLDPQAHYKIRVVYAGDMPKTFIRLIANDKMEIHPLMRKPTPAGPIEFDLPAEATSAGTLTLTWTSEPGRGGNGRGCQVAEVWLLKR